MSRDRRDEAGAVAILVSLLSVVLFLLAGLVVDLGHARIVKRHSQDTSDAAVLSAGNALYAAGTPTPDISGAVAAAKAYARDNFGVDEADWSGCSDPDALPYQPADTSCISFDDATQPTRVRVLTPQREVAMAFGGLAGVSSMDIASAAEATLTPAGAADCGLCLIGGGDHQLQNGNLTVHDANIGINGNVDIMSNGVASTNGLTLVEGDATGPSSSYQPAPLTDQPTLHDPLASMPMPAATGLSTRSDPCTQGPGTYGSYRFPNGTCVLQPGLYVVTGEWTLAGTAGMTATGVTLYFACGNAVAPRECAAPGEEGGWLNGHGNGKIQITAPPGGPTQGLAIVYERLNISPLWLTGNAGSTTVGTIYAYSADLDYRGNGCAGGGALTLVVVDTLAFSGTNACLAVHYQPGQNVYIPPHGLHLTR